MINKFMELLKPILKGEENKQFENFDIWIPITVCCFILSELQIPLKFGNKVVDLLKKTKDKWDEDGIILAYDLAIKNLQKTPVPIIKTLTDKTPGTILKILSQLSALKATDLEKFLNILETKFNLKIKRLDKPETEAEKNMETVLEKLIQKQYSNTTMLALELDANEVSRFVLVLKDLISF